VKNYRSWKLLCQHLLAM